MLFGDLAAVHRPADELELTDLYFAMARAPASAAGVGQVLNTNHFYRQPEIAPDTVLALNAEGLPDEHRRAKAEGIELRPVILGPTSLLLLSKAAPGRRRASRRSIGLTTCWRST